VFGRFIDILQRWWDGLFPLPAPPSPPPPTPPASDVVQRLLVAHNTLRATRGLPALRLAAALCASATRIATLCAQSGHLDHYAGGTTPAERISSAGYRYATYGENLAQAPGYTPEQVVQLWAKDPPHLANILADYQDVGFAVQAGIWAADFGKPTAGGTYLSSCPVGRIPGGLIAPAGTGGVE
jgi:uncharacterized protein YkwD